jgi:dimethylaniline monooxygenase (N-oxide forming)
LIPFIVEKTTSIGGIWKGAEGEIGTWNSLTANTSKVFSWISDHPWPKQAKEFPTRSEMLEYYTSFANKHGLFKFIKFNTSVTEVSKVGENYSVTFTSEGCSESRTFKYVILGTGYYSRLKDNIPGKERFRGIESRKF